MGGLAEQLHAVLVDGRHAELNRRLKLAYAASTEPRRLLRGHHDVAAFAEHLAAHSEIAALVTEVAGTLIGHR